MLHSVKQDCAIPQPFNLSFWLLRPRWIIWQLGQLVHLSKWYQSFHQWSTLYTHLWVVWWGQCVTLRLVLGWHLSSWPNLTSFTWTLRHTNATKVVLRKRLLSSRL